MDDIVDRIYVINMKKDTERLKQFKEQVKDLFSYEIYEGVDITDKKHKIIYKNWLSRTRNIDFENFNWKYYIRKYKDLRDHGILNKKKAWVHWCNFGKKELRSCNHDNQIVNKGQLGCLISHLEILKDAKKNNYKNILILEDDIIISKYYKSQLCFLNDYIRKQYDVIYLGASQHCWKNIDIKDNYYLTKNTTGGFAYIVNNTFYTEMITGLKQLNQPADVFLTTIQKKKEIIALYPNMFYVNLEHSNISMKRNNSEWFSKFRWDDNVKIKSACGENKVLVVLPTLNRSQNIENVINMFKNQTYDTFDLYIINDGSNDYHTEQLSLIEHKYKNDHMIKFTKNLKNLKIAKTLNKGIDYFLKNNYSYFTWVSDDNIYNENYIEELVKVKSDFSYSSFLFDDKINNICSVNKSRYYDINDFIKNYRGCASFMWSKKAILLVGYYSEDLMGCEDYEYILRTFHNIKNINYIKTCLMTYIRDDVCGFVKNKQGLLKIKKLINCNYLNNIK